MERRAFGLPLGFVITLIGIVVIAAVSILLYELGYHAVANFLSSGGILLWFCGVIAWIVIADSKKRWPGIGIRERFVRVITFR